MQVFTSSFPASSDLIKSASRASVTSKDIQDSLAETDRQFRDIDRKQIILKKPIKRTGDFEVEVKIHQDINATLKIKVSATAQDETTDDE